MTATPHSRKILMLGASGKLGRMLRVFWSEAFGQETELVPVFRTPTEEKAARVWMPGMGPEALPRVDAVIALWGVTRGTAAELAQNVALAETAVALGAALEARVVLHCSSVAVYEIGDKALSEDSRLAPQGNYGQSKLEMETRIAAGAEKVQARQVVMRIGNVAGADSLFANLRPGGRVTLDRFADGRAPGRSYIGPRDLAHAIAALIQSEVAGPINVGAAEVTRMDELARAADAQIDWRTAPEAALPEVRMDVSALQRCCFLDARAAEATQLVAQARQSGVWP